MKRMISKWLMGDIVVSHKTNVPFDIIIETLTEVVKENNFSVLVSHNFKETYRKKGLQVDDDFEYKVVQICNAEKSHKAIYDMSLDMGVMMPKSIIVSHQNGVTTLRYMKLKPWMVSMMFPDIDIVPMSKKVSEIMGKIVSETIKKAGTAQEAK